MTTPEEGYVYSNGVCEETLRQREYWRQVAESDGFDLDNVTTRGYIQGLREVKCNQKGYFHVFRELTNGYAKVGLHRYNMLQDTSYEFCGLIKFNMLMSCLSSYYLTLTAHDPVSGVGNCIFQVRVDEHDYNNLNITVSVARPKMEVAQKKKQFTPHGSRPNRKCPLPGWPSDDDFSDQTRFYTLERSELDTIEWVRVCFELVVCGHHRQISHKDLSDLELLKVVIETKEDEKLKAKSAIIYITYKGWDKPPRLVEVGKHVTRRAIVRRVLDVSTDDMTLLGKLLGTDEDTRKRTRNRKHTHKRRRSEAGPST